MPCRYGVGKDNPVRAATMVQPVWSHKNRSLILFQPLLRLLGSKATVTTMTNTNSNIRGVTEEEEEMYGNDNTHSNHGDVDVSGEVKGLCKEGRVKETLDILHSMDRGSSRIDSSTYASLLQECTDKKALSEGKLVHAHMIDIGFNPDMFVGNNFVIMYGKCGSLADARRVLDEMPKRNVVSWTAMMAAYARHGHNEEALTLYFQMQREGIRPNEFTFASILPACTDLAALQHGEEVHRDIIRSGFWSNVFVGSALVNLYAKCGGVDDARKVFDEMPERNVVSWNVMIAAYAQNGQLDEALTLFQKTTERDIVTWTAMMAGYAQNGRCNEALKVFGQMRRISVKPDPVIFASVLSACVNLASLIKGKEVHGSIIRSGFQSHTSVGSALVDMYAKCGTIDDARKVFDELLEPDVVSWSAMIAGHARNGHVDEALKLLKKMPERDVVSWNLVIAGYAQNGQVAEALKLFEKTPERDTFSWNALIAGYAQDGQVDEALQIFQKMPKRNAVSWTTMIAAYAQNEQVDEALKVFQKMPERDLISWNAIISGHAQNGHFSDVLKLFEQMQRIGVKPDSVTFTSILAACANLTVLIAGKKTHANVIKCGFQSHSYVGSTLVDMYSKCGIIEDARQVFDEVPERDVVSWNAMIVGYAKHGCGKEALELFEQMPLFEIRPNHVTFIGVLSACSHAGLVDCGWQYFNSMNQDYHRIPAVEHYCCMVDLLGRAGHLDEAYDFINKMPIKPNAVVWGSLLGACRIHANIELGERVAEHLFELDPKNDACYVLLANIYAASGRWYDVEKVRTKMKDGRVKKIPGFSWIEVNNKVFSFLVRDRLHPHMHKICSDLERLSQQMKVSEYALDTNLVTCNVEEEQKEHVLCHHS